MENMFGLTLFEILLIFIAALGLLYFISEFPLDPITFVYQEI